MAVVGYSRPVMATVALCDAVIGSQVFNGYAYGDPLPIYARYIGEDDDSVTISEAVTIYVRCERETGHLGRHAARGPYVWDDADSGGSQVTPA